MNRQASNESGTSSSSSSSSEKAANTVTTTQPVTTIMQTDDTASMSQYVQNKGITQYVTSAPGGATYTGHQPSYTSMATTTTHQSGQPQIINTTHYPAAVTPQSTTQYTSAGGTGSVSQHSGIQYTTQNMVSQHAPGIRYTAASMVPSGSFQYSSGCVGTSQAQVQQQAVSSELAPPIVTTSRGQSVATETSRVVGVEYGEQRVISVSQRVDESRQSILSERYVEHEIKIPKKIVREEVIEKVIVVPERIIHEEIIDEVQKVREKIIEVARPTIIEKTIEVPEIEIVEKIIEVPEKIIKEKVREEVKVQYQERIIEVPKVVVEERIVEVPEVHHRDVPVERIVEIPEIVDQVVYKDVPVPQYVDKPVPNYVTVEVPVNVERKVPVPVEAEVTFEYRIPQLKAAYGRVSYPVYLPRFIEVPIAAELLSESLTRSANQYLGQVQQLSKAATSLCEIEGLATNIMRTDFQSQLSSVDLQSAVLKAWQSNVINVSQTASGSQAPVIHQGDLQTHSATDSTTGVDLSNAKQPSAPAMYQTSITYSAVQPSLVGGAQSITHSTAPMSTTVYGPVTQSMPTTLPPAQAVVQQTASKKSKKHHHKSRRQ